MAKITDPSDIDFQAIIDKKPTVATVGFCDWFIEKSGVKFPSKAHEQAFRDGVKAGGELGGAYAKSPERLAAREAIKAARAAKAAEPKPAKAKAAAKEKAPAKSKAKPAGATDLI